VTLLIYLVPFYYRFKEPNNSRGESNKFLISISVVLDELKKKCLARR